MRTIPITILYHNGSSIIKPILPAIENFKNGLLILSSILGINLRYNHTELARHPTLVTRFLLFFAKQNKNATFFRKKKMLNKLWHSFLSILSEMEWPSFISPIPRCSVWAVGSIMWCGRVILLEIFISCLHRSYVNINYSNKIYNIRHSHTICKHWGRAFHKWKIFSADPSYSENSFQLILGHGFPMTQHAFPLTQHTFPLIKHAFPLMNIFFCQVLVCNQHSKD